MPEVELSAGVIEYVDTGGSGPVLVFLHGLTMNGTVWDHVVSSMPAEYRCIMPTLPLGGHRLPMNIDADLSLLGLGLLVGEFLERLDLHDVTLVQNDWGGVQILIANGSAERIGRLVITSCEAFENYPPGLPGAVIGAAMRVPGGLRALLFGLKFTPIRRAPGSWGWMSLRPVPKPVMDAWFAPATHNRLIRRDLRKYGLSIPDDATLLRWTDACRGFERPVLVVWGHDDKIMPIEHGRRLSRLFPDASLVELHDTYTLIPIDQPERLAAEIDAFVARD
ncbi:alpha/beta fold hydrolase [Rhodococcoides kyotonense]|uniref:Pimeloyl-ACP methyl ester carboxylesterase n=1 Tax=Rhodococcoides kyotonense TaxID=398843 RepID=A0A239MU79_9NOCA|nr:alpha/beta hydrolase [Rhodococcus kyotonensis]SNT46296.1 Pimeloyl-ACP methyl ester carboxylesterase [Rhodococcus kyotonensis]